MGHLKGVLVYVLVGIVTGVASLDVYLDTEKRIQVPGNIDINCSLPNIPNNHMALSPLHIDTLVETEDRVWVGWQRSLTKWIDFRGCRKTNFSSEIKNKSIDISDPFLDCYKFCDSFSIMLSSIKCFCTNTSLDPERSGLEIVNSSFVGNTNNVMCMYQPLTNYKHELDEQRDGNCLFAFKAENKLNFSSALCLENKASLCVARTQKKFYILDKKISTWLNISAVCKNKGYFFPSYSMIKENREKATKEFKDTQQYWIAAFRRPLNTCLAAVLYTNGTLGEPKPTPCNTQLRSLCIRSVESGVSTGKIEPRESTGKVEPRESTGNVEPRESTGKFEPTESMGKVEHRESTGTVEPRESTGNVEPRESKGTVEPRESTGKVEPRESTGTVEPRESTGTVEPGGSMGNVEPRESMGNVEPRESMGNVEPRESTGTVEPRESMGKVERGESTGNVEPRESTGNVEPGGSMGKVEPRGSMGNVEPRESTGTVEPRESTGKVERGESTGNVEPRESMGNVEPRGSMGNVEPRESTGTVEPRESTGKVERGESTGNVEPGGSMGKVEPRESTGNVEPGGSTGKSDQTPGYVWGIVVSVCMSCFVIAILLYLYMRKVSESKNKTKRRSSPVDKAVTSTQTRGGVQPQRQHKSATIEETRENEYHTIGASCHLAGSDEEIYHELHEKPRSQETHDCSNYDHVTHAMIADNNHYDVFCKKGKPFNPDNVISDYDTTFSIQQQIEGDYDTAGGQEIDRDLSEYDSIAGPSRANEENSI